MWNFKRVVETGKGPPGDRGSVDLANWATPQMVGEGESAREIRQQTGSTARDPAKYHDTHAEASLAAALAA